MIEFQKLNEKDFEKINKYLLLDETRSCEKIGAALMMWRNFYGIEWSVFDETLIIKYKTDYSLHFSCTYVDVNVYR